MLIGVVKEIKNHEYRVGLTPASVRELTHYGHHVVVEKNAGEGIGFSNEDYIAFGASILNSSKEVFANADMIVKVKEPQSEECAMLREGQLLFTYLHLAPDFPQTMALLNAKCIGIAYETVTNDHGGLPLLAPMSEVAGRMSIQVGATALQKEPGGAGILLGGVPGVAPAKVTIIGGGAAGTEALRIAVGMGAEAVVIERSLRRLQELDLLFGSKIKTIISTLESIEHYVCDSDLVIGAVLLPGAAAPKLVTHDMIRKMRRGSVLVDIAIDQGGCFETSKPTTHAAPTYTIDGIVHYCVTNIPGAVPRTSTFALNNATLPYVLAIANKGYKQAMLDDIHLRNGLNVHKGRLTHPAVANALNLEYSAVENALL
ncbi:MAG: alanine dehydrogenase [Alphaproteobacteria bacterium]|nr:alanine dehydrogenase [Alphaproteobacteria bacterium]